MLSLNLLVCLTFIVLDGTMALMVTSPSRAASWNLQMSNTITWTSVVTDPSMFDIVLVNNNVNCAPTGMRQVIKEKVSSSDGRYEISHVAPVKPCDGYQLNLEASVGVDCEGSGILAQSPPFTVITPVPAPMTPPATKPAPAPTSKTPVQAAPTDKSPVQVAPAAQTPAQVVSPNCNTSTPVIQPMADKAPQNQSTVTSATSKPAPASPLSNFTMTGGMAGGAESSALAIAMSFPNILSAVALFAFTLCFQ